MKTPAVIPIMEVIAKPLKRPAPAQYNGRSANKEVRYAVMTTKRALLSLFDMFVSFPVLASSKITICWSIPVPIVARIPAIDGRSKFHFINEATPRIINNSEKEVSNTAKEDLNLL